MQKGHKGPNSYAPFRLPVRKLPFYFKYILKLGTFTLSNLISLELCLSRRIINQIKRENVETTIVLMQH